MFSIFTLKEEEEKKTHKKIVKMINQLNVVSPLPSWIHEWI